MASHPPVPETPTRQASKRLAPPSLSFGPSSQDAPQASSSPQTPALSSVPPTSTTNSTPAQPSTRPSPNTATASSSHYDSNTITTQRPLRTSSATAAQAQRKPSATAETWNALQSTLEEVELNALSGASVFGAEHSRALEELRRAQIELARAWARSEADGDGDGLEDVSASAAAGVSGGGGGDKAGAGDGKGEEALVTPGSRSAVLARDKAGTGEPGRQEGRGGGKLLNGSGVNSSSKAKLEEETENDIKMARERRLANDRYFERVNKGVVDVVAKLEVVAQKMGGVEMESQEIWGDDSDSLDSARG